MPVSWYRPALSTSVVLAPCRLASNWPYDKDMQPADAFATIIRDAFEDYHARFADVTRRARLRFETRDWAAARIDAVERIELYDQCVGECMLRLEASLQQGAHDRELWSAIRDSYGRLIDGLIDRELFKTFYNTLTRRFFSTRGVDTARGIRGPGHRAHRRHHPSGRTAQLCGVGAAPGRYLHPAAGRLPFQRALRAPHTMRGGDSGAPAGRPGPLGAQSAAFGGTAGNGVLPRASRLPDRPRVRRTPLLSVRDRAGQRCRRPARGRGADPSRRRGASLQLFAQLFPCRPGHGGRCGGVPAHAAAGQTHRRDLHRAGPRQAGQDRTLPHLLPPLRRAVRTSN